MRADDARKGSEETATAFTLKIDYNILCCSFLTLVANKINSKRFGARLSHREFVRTDDTTQETATAFTVSKTSHN